MAFQNGNKPIVTNGLVYALDFGNPRSYITGSNTAKSLVFDSTVITSITGSPQLNQGVLLLTGSQFIRRTGSIDTFGSSSAFTVQVVAKADSGGNLFSINTPVGILASSISPSGSSIGFSIGSNSYSRTYNATMFSRLQHITYRYSFGSVDFFINGIPLTASNPNAAINAPTAVNALLLNSNTNAFSGSLAQFYVYNRALTADEIYQNYLVSAVRNRLPEVPKPYNYDDSAYKFVQAVGITDSNTISALSTFVSGLKSTYIRGFLVPPLSLLYAEQELFIKAKSKPKGI